MTKREEFLRVCRLREQAIHLGMIGLALVYGWWALRLGQELVEERWRHNQAH